jgi:gamma-glutamylcyclotransferase (GGCT)/AIG2-like uncharacterized protein YtfP
MEQNLFVYGTLRREFRHPMYRVLAAEARFEGMARYAGRLYDLGAYPGVVPAPEGPAGVLGELYALPRPQAVLSALDRYEGCTDRYDPGAEYRRELQPVLREDGQVVNAWIYLYNRSCDDLTPIAGGDYLRHGQRGSGRR